MTRPLRGSRWQAWFALGVIRFGLSPADFWALSLPEWLALVRTLTLERTAPLSRTSLETLMDQFPDRIKSP